MDKLSYIPSKAATIVRGTTIASLLDQRAKDMPNKAANIIRNLKNTNPPQLSREVLTFTDLARNSLNLASSLLCLGIKPKDKIVVIGGCCAEYLYLEYACQRVSVLNIRLPETLHSLADLVNVVKRYDAKALVVESGEIEKRLSDTLQGLFSGDNIGLDGLQILSFSKAGNKLHHKWKTLRELCEECDMEEASVRTIQDRQTPGDASVVLPTSGSTGTPKFVVYSHDSHILKVTLLMETCFNPQNPEFVYITDRAASWFFGFTMLSAILGCVTVHLDASVTFARRGVELYVDVVNEERATDSFCLAYLLHDLMCATREGIIQLPATLQNVSTGGELIPRAIWDFAKSSFDTFGLAYGSTETVSISRTPASKRSANSTFEDFQWMEPRPEMEVKVTDDAGRLLPKGDVGNISVKSPFVMLGYLEDDAATRAVQSGGWLSTGDVGCVNEDGLLKVVGRVKDVISKGSNKIYPVQVETEIYKNPKVLKILAIAVPDERLYNEVCACVIPTLGTVITVEELRQFCEKQFISDVALALPKYFMILEEYPKLSSGKVDKSTLRKMAISRFNISEK